MSVALVMFTDGRDHVFDDVRRQSWEWGLRGDIVERIIFDDSGDLDFTRRLGVAFPGWDLVSWQERRGFGGTINGAWKLLAGRTGFTHVFHLEDDFELLTEIDLDVLAGMLDRHPQLVQLALRRQPWNDAEIAAGGIVELNPGAFDESGDSYGRWLEHRLFFTTNPSIYRRSLCTTGWPDTDQSEGRLTHRILRDGTPEVGGEYARFAFFGGRHSGVTVQHVGTARRGVGY